MNYKYMAQHKSLECTPVQPSGDFQSRNLRSVPMRSKYNNARKLVTYMIVPNSRQGKDSQESSSMSKNANEYVRVGRGKEATDAGKLTLYNSTP